MYKETNVKRKNQGQRGGREGPRVEKVNQEKQEQEALEGKRVRATKTIREIFGARMGIKNKKQETKHWRKQKRNGQIKMGKEEENRGERKHRIQ